MKHNEIEAELRKFGLDVHVCPTREVFPDMNVIEPHYAIRCQTEEEMNRVHYWICFMKPEFDGFYAIATHTEPVTSNE